MEPIDTRFLRYLVLAVLFTCASPALAQDEQDVDTEPGTVQLGQVIALRYHTIDPALHEEAEAAYAKTLARFFDHHIDGVDLVFMKADRGARPNQYLELWNFETVEARDDIFPTEEGPHRRWNTLMDLWQESHGGVLSEQIIGEVDFMGDFILIGPGEFTAMPEIKLLGIHHMNVKPGSEERFEHYVSQQMNPFARSGALWHLYFKGDRGPMKGKYIELYAFDPVEARDRYWPEPGIASEEGDRMLVIYQQLWEGMAPMLEEQSEAEYSDWMLVR
jgi:hypothetical protein